MTFPLKKKEKKILMKRTWLKQNKKKIKNEKEKRYGLSKKRKKTKRKKKIQGQEERTTMDCEQFNVLYDSLFFIFFLNCILLYFFHCILVVVVKRERI